MQHDNLKAPKLKLTQEAETLPSAAQLIALTAPFRSRQLVTCLSHHFRSTRTVHSRLFDLYFSEFMQQYSYRPWCNLPLVTPLTTNRQRRRVTSHASIGLSELQSESDKIKYLSVSFKREISELPSNHFHSIRTLHSRLFELYFSKFMRQYSYRPWCNLPLVTPPTTSGGREARDMLALVGLAPMRDR